MFLLALARMKEGPFQDGYEGPHEAESMVNNDQFPFTFIPPFSEESWLQIILIPYHRSYNLPIKSREYFPSRS